MTKRKKPKFRREIDLKTLTNLITLLDCYRIDRYVELDSMEKAIEDGKLGKFDVRWKEIRRILYKIGGLSKLSAIIDKLLKIRGRVKILSMIGTYFFVFGLGVFVLTFFNLCPEWLKHTYAYVAMPAIIIILGTRLADEYISRKIALEIEELSKSHPKKFRFLRARLRDIAQDLINRLGKHIKNRREDADKYRIDLYNADYEGIKILKKPGTLRKHYTVVCKT